MRRAASAFESSPAAAIEADRRGGSRYRVNLAVDLRTRDGIALSDELTNLSRSGFRTRCAVALSRGEAVTVRIQGHGLRRARVAWQVREEIGCRFATPLAPDVLEALLAR